MVVVVIVPLGCGCVAGGGSGGRGNISNENTSCCHCCESLLFLSLVAREAVTCTRCGAECVWAVSLWWGEDT